MIGKRYNNLVAIEEIPLKGKQKVNRWLFQCDCGDQMESPPGMVRSDRIKCCGCPNIIEEMKIRNPDSIRFENLTMIKRISAFKWIFRCDCGHELRLYTSQANLLGSCGCKIYDNDDSKDQKEKDSISKITHLLKLEQRGVKRKKPLRSLSFTYTHYDQIKKNIPNYKKVNKVRDDKMLIPNIIVNGLVIQYQDKVTIKKGVVSVFHPQLYLDDPRTICKSILL